MTSELEYQSQHTEDLFYVNQKLEEDIKLFKIQLKEHKEVESELAKRSHFCNRVIKKYKGQIKGLDAEIKARKESQGIHSVSDTRSVNTDHKKVNGRHH